MRSAFETLYLQPVTPALATWNDQDTRLIACALSGVFGIVVLITLAKVHPFLALMLGSGWTGLTAGLPAQQALSAFEKGAGDTLANVGVVVALGAMFGKLLADSGGAERVVSVILGRAGRRGVPWAIAVAAMLIGIPIFFEVGVVLLMPIVLLLARKTGGSVLRVGIPALAGLSVLHGLIPPHPGPLMATAMLKADLGETMAYGLLVAVPTVVIAGPLFGALISRRLELHAPAQPPTEPASATRQARSPSFAVTLAMLLLPVALMLTRAVVDLAGLHGRLPAIGRLLGDPLVAMLVTVLAATFPFGYARGASLLEVGRLLGDSLAPASGIILIIGAGGGFKQTLVSTGIGDTIGKVAQNSDLPPLLLAWLIAAAIRVATGSATVATLTAAGLMASIAPTIPSVSLPLMALSIGAGSLFFSHVNDAGFWLVKEYFGMSVGETLKSWSAMETIISVVGMSFILALNAMLATAPR